MTSTVSSIHWADLLVEPKAITGPYGGSAPALSTFSPHSWRAHFDHVAIAGQFLILPDTLPTSWGPREKARAEVVFEFHEVRFLQTQGVLERGIDDDSLHGNPCGVTGVCSLTDVPEPYLTDSKGEVISFWKRFEFTQDSFSIRIEAGNVYIYCGRRASAQFGGGFAV
jgi:hypothetical protein